MTNNKRALVTGATGFIGSNLVRRLLDLNFKVHILLRQSSNPWRLKDKLSSIICHQINLLNKEDLQKNLHKIKPIEIYHLANAGLYSGIENNTKKYLDVNLQSSINLINASLDLDYECFVNTGSSSEYGAKNKPMGEDDLCEPESVYGITKLASTLYAKTIAKKYNKPILTLRLFSPYGPFDHPSRLIPYTIVRVLKNEEVLLNSSTSVRDYIYVDDVINAYIACINKAALLKGETVNIGSGKQTTTGEVVKLIFKNINSKSKITWGDTTTKRYESKIWKANINKAKKELEWSPKFTLETGLNKTIDWFKNNLNYYG